MSAIYVWVMAVQEGGQRKRWFMLSVSDACASPLRAEAITDEELDRYKQALGRPGCLHAGLNYYRAAIDGMTWAAPARPPCAPDENAPHSAAPLTRTHPCRDACAAMPSLLTTPAAPHRSFTSGDRHMNVISAERLSTMRCTTGKRTG